MMFGAPRGSIDKKSPMRQKSKIAVLACGFQGSVGALKAFGALEMGLKEEELKPIVYSAPHCQHNFLSMLSYVISPAEPVMFLDV
jgi:DNA polymerase